MRQEPKWNPYSKPGGEPMPAPWSDATRYPPVPPSPMSPPSFRTGMGAYFAGPPPSPTSPISQQVIYVMPAKSLGVAYLLWIFLGLFGAHQFYLNKGGRGLGYLLTFAWCTVGWWVDLFTLPAQVHRVNCRRNFTYP